MRRALFIGTALLVLAAALAMGQPALGQPAAAGAPGEDLETFRGQLAEFVGGLEGLPGFDAARVAAARQRIAELPPAELEALRQRAASHPDWTALPQELQLLASRTRVLEEEIASLAQEELAGKAGSRAPAAADKDVFSDLENALKKLDDARKEIEKLSSQIDDFVHDFSSSIGDISNVLKDLPGKISGSFNGLSADVQAFVNAQLGALKAQVPTDPEGLLARLGLEGEQWYSSVVGQIPEIDLPCPAAGTVLPGIGTVGTTEADYVCKRGLDWIAGAAYDLTPGDVYSSLGKLTAAGFYYPINYLCLCLEAEAAVTGWDEDAAHRADLAAKLDTALSTRATESSVALLRVGLTDLDADVAKVEAKLDVLEVEAGDAGTAAADQQEFLDAFRDLVLRVEIEQNLIEHPNDVVASFQLPEALGGFLELARAIAADTIRMNQAAAQRTFNATQELGKGDASFRAGDYPRAYQSYQRAYRESVKP